MTMEAESVSVDNPAHRDSREEQRCPIDTESWTASMRNGCSQTHSNARTITVWSNSRAQPAGLFCEGEDLVLEVGPADGLKLAHGVALEDYLGSDTRHAVDVESRARYEQWRARRAPSLTVEGVDLTHIWEVELLAECFLPAARLMLGLPPALAATGARRLLARGMDGGLDRLLAAVAQTVGVEVVAGGGRRVEMALTPRRAPSRLGRLAARFGVPPLVRGEVLALTYWHMAAVFAEISRRDTMRIASAPLPPRDIGARIFALSARGGWMGMPGPRARESSRAKLVAALGAVPELDGLDAVEDALDCLALDTLGRMALETLAHVRHARRALSHGKVRLAVLPFDSHQQARMLLTALNEKGAQSLLVQHGFAGRLGDPDMSTAEHLAVWSEHDRQLGGQRRPDEVTVTGNPGVGHLLGIAPRMETSLGVSVVLVDYAGRLSISVGGRVTMQHVETALRALAAARPGSIAVVRPHPADLAPGAYAELAACCPQLRLEVDQSTPIEALLASADLCIGAVSTATLQACVLGVRTVFLDVSGASRPWPFEGSELPRAVDLDTLTEAIASVLRTDELTGRDAALEALGVRGDAVERVIGLMEGLLR